MKKITKALIGTGILLSGIGAAIAIGKKATGSEVDDKYFDYDFSEADDFFEETDDYDGDVDEDTEE